MNYQFVVKKTQQRIRCQTIDKIMTKQASVIKIQEKHICNKAIFFGPQPR